MSYRKSRSGHPTPIGFSSTTSLGYLVNATARLMARALNAQLAKYGIGHGIWPVLMFLWEKDGQSQQELSQQIGLEESTLTRTLDRMERDELICRKRSTKDRRKVLVFLTEKSWGFRVDLTVCAESVNQQAMGKLSNSERSTLVLLLQKIKQKLESEL